MKTVTVINYLTIKEGKIDEYLEIQQRFAAQRTMKPDGLLGSRIYRSADGKSVVLVSQFESQAAQQQLRESEEFKQHLQTLLPLVETASPAVYEEVSTTGRFI
jgi:heme-degrading monooxygenase HmoA